ncbi:MAG TPA: HAMP domain-containing sensor histidine kinase [Polyangiaceae bacterium]|jgi:signal transduction histidine kinase|nr:HAMP domain-containing sensor histidine kinase [Polyangiaceae bacterium]
MSRAATRLVSRLVAIQLLAWVATGLLVVAFAPRLLLLDVSVTEGTAARAVQAWVVAAGFVVMVTLIAGRRARPLLRALIMQGRNIEPQDIHALYAAPSRLVALDLAIALLVGVATLVPPIRPETNDVYTQLELVLLIMTMATVAVLPAYVAMRASVAKVLELVPVAAARDAVDLLGTPQRRAARLRQRLLAAVFAPVAFVALGASLLVHAHVRALDTSSRENDAAALAQGIFDAVDGDVRGRREAADVARAHGLDVTLARPFALFSVARNDEGRTLVTVPLADGHALVRFETSRPSGWTGLYLALALTAIAIAGGFGYRIGGAFADDVGIATQEIEATGVAEVLRGGHIRGDVRFQSVEALMSAADQLGGVFREFASAQQRAIDARAATERTRGLFLASMSHDLKAPLNAILGFAELVSHGTLTDEQRESVAIIERRGRELLYLIDTILDAARVEAGELTVSPESTHVGDVVMPAVLDARELTKGISLHIVGEIQPGVPRILVDPARLTQALTAIILVASRFGERGQVVVRAAMPTDGGHLRIDVEVSGRDTTAEDREKVFEAFKHLDHARRHGSLGLGPSLARAIVELHGGRVAVETTEAGGSVFHVWVPSERASRYDPVP